MPALPTVARRLTPHAVRRARARRRAGLEPGARIFGLGLSRTGTSSLSHAFTVLGYRSLHYPDDDQTRAELVSYLADGAERLRLSVLDRVDALTEDPGVCRLPGSGRGLPGSRFVLTMREKESWLESCSRLWAVWLEPYLRDRPSDDPGAIYISAIHKRLYGAPSFDRDRFARAYDDYHRRVRTHFSDRPNDLLSVDLCAGDGWEPLCNLLNLGVPRSPFPWLNRAPPADA